MWNDQRVHLSIYSARKNQQPGWWFLFNHIPFSLKCLMPSLKDVHMLQVVMTAQSRCNYGWNILDLHGSACKWCKWLTDDHQHEFLVNVPSNSFRSGSFPEVYENQVAGRHRTVMDNPYCWRNKQCFSRQTDFWKTDLMLEGSRFLPVESQWLGSTFVWFYMMMFSSWRSPKLHGYGKWPLFDYLTVTYSDPTSQTQIIMLKTKDILHWKINISTIL